MGVCLSCRSRGCRADRCFRGTDHDWNQTVSAEFAVNRKLGRAWIDVKVTMERYTEEPPTEEVFMKMVEGLYYDSARKQVLYRMASEPIVCAEDATYLWTTYLKSTGQCL